MLDRPIPKRAAVALLLLFAFLVGPLTFTASGTISVNAAQFSLAQSSNEDRIERTLGRSNLLASPRVAVSGLGDVVITVSYSKAPTDGLWDTKATMYLTFNGAKPSATASTQRVMNQSTTTPNPQTDSPTKYTTTFSREQLASASALRFIVGIRLTTPPATSAAELWCDYGRDIPGTGGSIDEAACRDTGFPAFDWGYWVDVDNSRPVARIQTLPAAFATAKTVNVTKGTVPSGYNNTFTRDKGVGIRIFVQDAVTAGSAFGAELNTASIYAVVRTNETGPLTVVNLTTEGIVADNVAARNHTITLPQGTVDWSAVGAADRRNQDLQVNLSMLTDKAGNRRTLHRTQILVVDSADPEADESAAWVIGDPQRKEGGKILTGLGATVTTRFNITDATLDKSVANASVVPTAAAPTAGSAVRVLYRNATLGFYTDPVPARFEGGRTWKAVNTFVGNATSTSPTSAFNVTIEVRMVDTVGHDRSEVSLGKLRVTPGPPTFGVSTNRTVNVPSPYDFVGKGVAKDGPYKVNATVIDGDGILNRSVYVRMSNATGRFWGPSPPTGWTKVNNHTFQRKMVQTKPGPLNKATQHNYTVEIPDAADGTRIEFYVNATDKIGNSAKSANVTFSVDKKGPLVAEATPHLEWRAAPPVLMTFGAADVGTNQTTPSGINATSGVLRFRAGTSGDFEANKAPFNNTGGTSYTATLTGASFGVHRAKVEYYAEFKDVLGNVGSNGTKDAPRNYTVDAEKPTTTLEALPATDADGRVTLKAIAVDPDSGVANVVFQGAQRLIGTTAWGPWVEIASQKPQLFDACLAGRLEYKFRAYAVDNVGNQGEKSSEAATRVEGKGCQQDITITFQDPKPAVVLDAQGGTGKTVVRYTANPVLTFTNKSILKVNLTFSPDNGQTFIPIPGASRLANTGTFSWNLTVPSCDACRLKLIVEAPDGTRSNGTSAPFEIINGSTTTDLDANDVFDECELEAFGRWGDPRSNATQDVDGDGLTTKRECEIGTSPADFDSDGDSVGDGAEVKVGRDPLDVNDVPSSTDLRYEQWGAYALAVPALFLAVLVVFLIGLARRW